MPRIEFHGGVCEGMVRDVDQLMSQYRFPRLTQPAIYDERAFLERFRQVFFESKVSYDFHVYVKDPDNPTIYHFSHIEHME